MKKQKRGRPPTGETPVRQFRCTGELWERIKRIAHAQGRSASAYIVETLERRTKRDERAAKQDEQ